ncbi:hypothetical protein ACZ91_15390 [Streptomyces regensis]|nr:hypothetical protein ACZ91_15390 [Streptomyces regensis]
MPRDHIHRVQPMMILDQASTAESQLSCAVRSAQHLHCHGRALAVDATDTEPSEFAPQGPLGALIDRLEAESDLFGSLPILPVVRHGATVQMAASIGRLGSETGTGVAVRLRPSAHLAVELARLLAAVRTPPSSTDIVLDLGFVESATTHTTDRVVSSVEAVKTTAEFRSLVLLSGSVPAQLDRRGAWRQDRHEEQLWHAATTQHTDVLFGDYGVVHPAPGQGWRARHVSVKYSCRAGWWYGRRPIPSPDDAESPSVDGPPRARAFRNVCRDLTDDAVFAGPDFSWGDHALSVAADGGAKGLGDSSKPIAFATSHHLAYLAGMGTAA